MNAEILAVNAGSSSLKFAIYTDGATLDLLAKGEVAGLTGLPGGAPRFAGKLQEWVATKRTLTGVANPTDALQVVLDWIATQFPQGCFRTGICACN